MTPQRCCREAAKWAAPGVVLAVMPKCPACVAGYVALFTGVGVSVSAASYLRRGALALAVTILAYLVVRGIHQLSRRLP